MGVNLGVNIGYRTTRHLRNLNPTVTLEQNSGTTRGGLLGILASILPGVRDFRTPFVVGLLWVSSLSLALYIVYAGSLPDFKVTRALSSLGQIIPEGGWLAVIGGAAYVVGSIAEGIARRFEQGELRKKLLARIVKDDEGEKEIASWRYSLHEYLRIPGEESSRLVTSAVNDRLADLPAPVRGIAVEMIMSEFILAAHALNSTKPEQYQQYDRLRSEYEFRNGIWLPLLVLAVAIGVLLPWPERIVVWAIGASAAVALTTQAIDRRREANVYIAQSIYSGWAIPPLFASLISAMSKPPGIQELDTVGRIAWLVEFLESREMGGRLAETASRLRHPSWDGRLSESDRNRLWATLDKRADPSEPESPSEPRESA